MAVRPASTASFVFCILACTTGFSRSQQGNNGVYFQYPTDGLAFSYLDTVNVSYTSNFSAPLLYTFCKNASSGNELQENLAHATPYNGSMLVALSFQGVSECNFDLRPNTTAGLGANSPVFALLSSQRPQATTLGFGAGTSSTATPSPTSSSTGSGTAATATSAAAAAASTTTASSGLSTGAKAGIGIGVALGIVILGLVAGILVWRRRKPTKRAHAALIPPTTADKPGTPAHTPITAYEKPPNRPIVPPQELPAQTRPYELESGSPVPELGNGGY